MVNYTLNKAQPHDNIIAELRSDTFTMPDTAMLEAMMTAQAGDDVYGEDDSVNELQEYVAKITGKQSALFLSSGTQSNLVAMLAHCGRGEEVISGDKYHVVIDEAMGAAVLGGLAVHAVTTDEHGILQADDILKAIKPQDIHCPVSRLISLENTVWGRIQPYDNFVKIRSLANKHGLAMHLDGARLFNAIEAGNHSLINVCGLFDSVSLCLSKGLGAPVGTVLCGSEEFILKAVRLRKMLGGGMRQIGFLAAAGLYAVQNNIKRLRQDHDNATHLCNALQKFSKNMTEQPQCHTNMVFVSPKPEECEKLTAFMQKNGIMIPQSNAPLRLVTHKGTNKEIIDYVIDKFQQFYQ